MNRSPCHLKFLALFLLSHCSPASPLTKQTFFEAVNYCFAPKRHILIVRTYHYTILYIILYYIILYYIILYYIILYYIILYYITFYQIILYYIILYYIILYYIILNHIVLYSFLFYFIVLHCIILHFATFVILSRTLRFFTCPSSCKH